MSSLWARPCSRGFEEPNEVVRCLNGEDVAQICHRRSSPEYANWFILRCVGNKITCRDADTTTFGDAFRAYHTPLSTSAATMRKCVFHKRNILQDNRAALQSDCHLHFCWPQSYWDRLILTQQQSKTFIIGRLHIFGRRCGSNCVAAFTIDANKVDFYP